MLEKASTARLCPRRERESEMRKDIVTIILVLDALDLSPDQLMGNFAIVINKTRLNRWSPTEKTYIKEMYDRNMKYTTPHIEFNEYHESLQDEENEIAPVSVDVLKMIQGLPYLTQ